MRFSIHKRFVRINVALKLVAETKRRRVANSIVGIAIPVTVHTVGTDLYWSRRCASINIEDSSTSRQVLCTGTSLSCCRKSDSVINCHEVVIRITADPNPCCFSICKSCSKKTCIHSLTINCLLFDTKYFKDICSCHELLKWFMSK